MECHLEVSIAAGACQLSKQEKRFLKKPWANLYHVPTGPYDWICSSKDPLPFWLCLTIERIEWRIELLNYYFFY